MFQEGQRALQAQFDTRRLARVAAGEYRGQYLDHRDSRLASFPGAQMVIRVAVREILPNCPRYVHRMQFVEDSAFVSDSVGNAPPPLW